ncbi:hypothetical protein K474DRAFT_896816 [Panus rudis PR-1116 ss-1]|nr:hypothetical protein K474DRAFT_896816 [Panus rudis PR-1116 ss-1]
MPSQSVSFSLSTPNREPRRRAKRGMRIGAEAQKKMIRPSYRCPDKITLSHLHGCVFAEPWICVDVSPIAALQTMWLSCCCMITARHCMLYRIPACWRPRWTFYAFFAWNCGSLRPGWTGQLARRTYVGFRISHQAPYRFYWVVSSFVRWQAWVLMLCPSSFSGFSCLDCGHCRVLCCLKLYFFFQISL